MAALMAGKGRKAKSAKGKDRWEKPRGNRVQASKRPLAVGPHRTRSLPPAASCNDMYEMPPREAHQKLSVSGFYWGLVTQTPYCTNIPDSQKEARCSAKTRSCRQDRHDARPLSAMGVLHQRRELLAGQVPTCQPKANVTGRPF